MAMSTEMTASDVPSKNRKRSVMAFGDGEGGSVGGKFMKAYKKRYGDKAKEYEPRPAMGTMLKRMKPMKMMARRLGE